MFCPKCGAEIANEASVCPACGAVTEQWAPAVEPAPESVSESPALTALKQTATSGAYLTAVISFTLVCVLSVLAAIINRFSLTAITDLAASIQNLLSGTPYHPDLVGFANDLISQIDAGAVNAVSNSFVLSGVLSVVPSLLISIGTWIVFASAKSGKGAGSAGLVMIKTVKIVQLVFTCILCAALIAAGILAIVFSAPVSSFIGGSLLDLGVEKDYTNIIFDVLRTFGIVYTVIVIGVSAFIISLDARTVTTVGSALKTAKTGQLCKNVSGFVAVMLFIGAPGMLSTVLTLALTGNFVGAISTLASITASVAFGITIFSYKSKLKNII